MTHLAPIAIDLPADLATAIERAVEGGDYASTSEVVREALQDWHARRMHRSEAMAALKSDIDIGLADVAAGRIGAFDADRIIDLGRQRLAARSPAD
jgi:antitoxin ParD1/3/4